MIIIMIMIGTAITSDASAIEPVLAHYGMFYTDGELVEGHLWVRSSMKTSSLRQIILFLYGVFDNSALV